MLVGHKLTVKMNLSLGLLSYGIDNRPIGSSTEAFTIAGFGLLGTMSHQCSWMLVYWLLLPGPCTYSRDTRFMCLTRANNYHCESHTHPCCLSCRCCCKNIRPSSHRQPGILIDLMVASDKYLKTYFSHPIWLKTVQSFMYKIILWTARLSNLLCNLTSFFPYPLLLDYQQSAIEFEPLRSFPTSHIFFISVGDDRL
jgi:hypothetical protein